MFAAHPLLLILSFGSIGFFSACGSSPEVIQVQGEARTAERTEAAGSDENDTTPFRFVIGELQQSYSIDPLFALYPASERMVGLIYEGLTRLDENGDVQPALAESWEVSEDSLRYTFKLREKAFFHDDPAFNTGQGRRVRAQDVRFVFTRMTERGVPEKAARMFNPHIEGFEAYFTQRRYAFFENERLMNHIPGITAVDENTIEFRVNAPAPEFLELLAHPQAAVYPEEAFNQRAGRGEARAVGSGPFVFSQMQGDTLVTLERNFDFYDENRVAQGLNSIQFRFYREEAKLFSALSAGEIQLIPQVGPLTAQTVLMTGDSVETLQLAQAYTGQLKLHAHQTQTFGIYFKENNNLSIPLAELAPVREALNSDSFSDRLPVFSTLVIIEDDEAIATGEDLGGELSIGSFPGAYTTFIAARLATDMNQAEGSENRNMSVYPLPRPHRDVLIYVSQEGQVQTDGLTLMALLNMPQFSVYRLDAGEIHFNEYSWWMSLKNAARPQAAELNRRQNSARTGR